MSYDLVLTNLGTTESAKKILRAEMLKRDVSLQQLTDMLAARGMTLTRAAVDNRISRGTFSADFFVECLRAMSCREIGVITKESGKDGV